MKHVFTFILAFFITVPVMKLPAQHGPGPFSYQPPLGVNRWTDPSGSEYAYIPITMDRLSALPASDDGLMVSFDLKLALNEESKPLLAVAFQGDWPRTFINIVYSKRTVTVTRNKWFGVTHQITYDYHLFDPLFEDIGTDVSARWNVKVYITSFFMYLVVSIAGIEVRNLMSPLYFGVDDQDRYPNNNSHMHSFIHRSPNAVISLGDPARNFPAYISNIRINSFVYGDWWKTVQREFSSPNPPTLVN